MADLASRSEGFFTETVLITLISGWRYRSNHIEAQVLLTGPWNMLIYYYSPENYSFNGISVMAVCQVNHNIGISEAESGTFLPFNHFYNS
jgi:hypothetical protein